MEATSAFSGYLLEKVKTLLNNANRFNVLLCFEVKEMVHSRNWKVAKVSPALFEKLGAITATDAILIGKFEDFNTKLKISVLVKDIRSREIITDVSMLIP